MNTGVFSGKTSASAEGAVPMMPTTAMSLQTAGRGSLSIRVIEMPNTGSDMEEASYGKARGPVQPVAGLRWMNEDAD